MEGQMAQAWEQKPLERHTQGSLLESESSGLCPCVRLPGTPLTLPPGHTARYQLIGPHVPRSQLSRGGQEAEGRPEMGAEIPGPQGWGNPRAVPNGRALASTCPQHLTGWRMGLLDQDSLSKGMPLIYPLIQSRGGRRESQWEGTYVILSTIKVFQKTLTHMYTYTYTYTYTHNRIQSRTIWEGKKVASF